MKKIKVLIANKYFLMNYAISCILKRIKEFEVRGVSETEIHSEILSFKPHILIVEVEILRINSYSLLEQVRNKFPQLQIIVLLDPVNKEKLDTLLGLELDGYLLKNASREELIHAATVVKKGDKYYSNEIQKLMHASVIERQKGETERNGNSRLSNREKEILIYITRGLTNRQIGEKLFISEHTVLTHRRNIMKKLKVKSTPQLILTTIKRNLIPINY